MGVLPVSMSLLASFMSAITLLGTPSEIYVYGTQYWMIWIGYVIMIPIGAYVTIPVFFRIGVTSVFEVGVSILNNKVSHRTSKGFGACQKHLFWAWISNYIPEIMCGVISYPCPKYRLLLLPYISYKDLRARTRRFSWFDILMCGLYVLCFHMAKFEEIHIIPPI